MSKAVKPTQAPLETNQQTAQTNQRDRAASMTLKAIITMVIEMIPGGIGPWGVGDIVTAIEAVSGRTLDGLHLTMLERAIYLGASAIPVVPARPVLAGWRWLANQQSQQKSR